ncbi:MAG: hypothetical protein R3C18_06870 [Planctomycetaceae bacterium]
MTTGEEFYLQVEILLASEGGIGRALEAVHDRFSIGDDRRDAVVTLRAEWDELKAQLAGNLVTAEEANVTEAKIRHSVLSLLRLSNAGTDEEECAVDPIPLINRVEIVSDFRGFLAESLAVAPQNPVVVVTFGHYLQGHTHLTKRLVSRSDGLRDQNFTVQPDVYRLSQSYDESTCADLFPQCLCRAVEVADLDALVRKLNGSYQESTLHVFELEVYSKDRADWKEMFPDIQAALTCFQELTLSSPVSALLLISIKLNGEKDNSWFSFLKRDTDTAARQVLEEWRTSTNHSQRLRVLPELGNIERHHISDWKSRKYTERYLKKKGIDHNRFNEKSINRIWTPDLTLEDFEENFTAWVGTEKQRN